MASTDPAAAEARLAEFAPGYLEQVRAAADRLAVGDEEPSDLHAALLSVEDTAAVDVDIPTAARLPMVRLLKRAVKVLIGWYLRYLGQQITAFGQAVVHFGGTLVERTEGLEVKTGALETQISELAARVERLEQPRR